MPDDRQQQHQRWKPMADGKFERQAVGVIQPLTCRERQGT
jgi:hypothetical protein